jgi:hypothetical protein
MPVIIMGSGKENCRSPTCKSSAQSIFNLFSLIACGGEAVGVFLGTEGVDELPDRLTVDAALGGLAQQRLELGWRLD